MSEKVKTPAKLKIGAFQGFISETGDEDIHLLASTGTSMERDKHGISTKYHWKEVSETVDWSTEEKIKSAIKVLNKRLSQIKKEQGLKKSQEKEDLETGEEWHYPGSPYGSSR